MLSIAMCVIALSPGCNETADTTLAVPTTADSMEAWRALVENPSKSMNDPNLQLLASGLSQSNPGFVDEVLAELQDPGITPEKLIALVVSLEVAVSPESVPSLNALTASDKPGPVRRAATHLLGWIRTEDAKTTLLALKDDPQETIRFTALLGLAQQGDQSVRQDLRDIYQRDNVTDVTRERIVLAACIVPIEDDRSILEDAIQTAGYEQDTYRQAVSVIGRIGTTDSIEALNALKANPDCSDQVREMCDNSIAAIEERSESATAESN